MALNGARVVSTRFPYLPITLTLDGRAYIVEALLDTGFDGDVVVPRDFLREDAAPVDYLPARLADGSELMVPTYVGAARIGTTEIDPISILSLGDVPIVGTNLIQHFMVMLDHGRRVIIEP